MEAIEQLKQKYQEIENEHLSMESKLKELLKKIEEQKGINQSNYEREKKLKQAIQQFYQRTETQEKQTADLYEKKQLLEYETISIKSRIIEFQRLLLSTIKQYEKESHQLNELMERNHQEIEQLFLPLNQQRREELMKELFHKKELWKIIYINHFQKFEKRRNLLLIEIDLQKRNRESIELLLEDNNDNKQINNNSIGHNERNAEERNNTATSTEPVNLSISSAPFPSNQPWFRENRKRTLVYLPLENQLFQSARFSNGLKVLQDQQNDNPPY